MPPKTMSLRQLNVRISLVVPALNEDRVIEHTVHEIIEQVSGRFSEYELILINDGSSDQTGQLMDRIADMHHSIRVMHNDTNIGLGACYQRGVDAARFEYVMMLCGDGGLPSESLPAIFDTIGTADIVVPYMLNLRDIKTNFRYTLSRTYTKLLNFLFRQKLKYYNGLPVHRLDLLRQIKIVSSGFGFQGEILVKLLKARCTYVEVGVLGAEKTNRSTAVSLRNFVNVARTLTHLIVELLFFFDPDSIVRNSPRSPDAPPDQRHNQSLQVKQEFVSSSTS